MDIHKVTRSRAVLWAAALVFGTCAFGCAAIKPSPQEQARELDQKLSAAGFQMVPATTSEQLTRLQSPSPLTVNRYVGADNQEHFWVADPYDCGCLFEGSDANYQKLQNINVQEALAKREKETAEMNWEAAQSYEFNTWGMGPPYF